MGITMAPATRALPLACLMLLLLRRAPGVGAQTGQGFELQQPQTRLLVTAGDTLNLNCTMSGDDLIGSMKWLKVWDSRSETVYGQTGSFPRVTRVVSGSDADFSIRISDVRPEDAGTYYCVKFIKSVVGEEEFRRGKGTEVSVHALPTPPVVSGPNHRAGPGQAGPFTSSPRSRPLSPQLARPSCPAPSCGSASCWRRGSSAASSSSSSVAGGKHQGRRPILLHVGPRFLESRCQERVPGLPRHQLCRVYLEIKGPGCTGCPGLLRATGPGPFPRRGELGAAGQPLPVSPGAAAPQAPRGARGVSWCLPLPIPVPSSVPDSAHPCPRFCPSPFPVPPIPVPGSAQPGSAHPRCSVPPSPVPGSAHPGSQFRPSRFPVPPSPVPGSAHPGARFRPSRFPVPPSPALPIPVPGSAHPGSRFRPARCQALPIPVPGSAPPGARFRPARLCPSPVPSSAQPGARFRPSRCPVPPSPVLGAAQLGAARGR
ncbi:uncharacterized protein LOC141951891, partial [Strix uralensis]|uniref:uncharacterized protein LOC141951891 n=1 Tax=Strix uralensis TaxID=36305 RepID=UPI003DA739B4